MGLVVDDVRRAEATHEVQVGRPCRGGHDHTQVGEQLYARRADGARRAVHQHALAGLDAGTPDRRQRVVTALGGRCGGRQVDTIRHGGDERGHADRDVLGVRSETALGIAEHLVPGREAGDLEADALDDPGVLGPPDVRGRPP